MNLDFLTSISPIFMTILSLAGFVVFWIIIATLISRVSGWNKLAEVYPDMTSGGEAEKKRGGARMNKIANYNGSIIFEATDIGLRMRQIFLFKFGHETLLIPWSDIESKESKFAAMNFCFTRLPDINISVSKKIGEWILEKKKTFRF